MKAGIYLGKENVVIKQLPDPVCGERDVVIRNRFSSICGTDVAVFTKGPGEGHRIDIGGEFGHETVSEVVMAGSLVRDLKPGDRVYPYPRYAKNDTKRAGTIGGFSEYILVPEAVAEHSLYHVPDSIPDRLACLIEPFTVGTRAARRGFYTAGQTGSSRTGVVFGCGTIGVAAAVALKYFGMEKVMICDRSDFRLAIASELGFETCNNEKENFKEKAMAYFGQAPSLTGLTADIDCWIDAAGTRSILNGFLKTGKIESRFVSVAVNKLPAEVDLLHMTYAQQSILGSGGYYPQDVRDVMAVMESGRWPLEKIITDTFTIDELPQAIRRAADTDHALNVVIRF